MPESKQQCDLQVELLLECSSQGFVLLRLADQLDGHLSLLVYPMVNPAVSPRSKFVPNKKLRHVGAPFILSPALYLPAKGLQVLGPRKCLSVFPKRKPPLKNAVKTDARTPPKAVEVLHTMNANSNKCYIQEEKMKERNIPKPAEPKLDLILQHFKNVANHGTGQLGYRLSNDSAEN
ncbi:hypothetical protein M5K25_024168 [Dendrobium thyrsiflorum]|uniref:Uncharacterized protein n=1 Tax=Dendrobium thyrsiflorum TaxID=117978 RepID=A0ABD0U189_DENTH